MVDYERLKFTSVAKGNSRYVANIQRIVVLVLMLCRRAKICLKGLITLENCRSRD